MNTFVQALISLVPLGVAAFATYSAIKANRITSQVEQQKVDAAAYDRAKQIYESSLALLEKRCEQFERQLDQVQRENDRMQRENEQMRRQMTEMRARMTAAGLKEDT